VELVAPLVISIGAEDQTPRDGHAQIEAVQLL
jgi:hypothetical protein